jgi:hypothetical protein
MESEVFVADGINASTGAPLFAPKTIDELAAIATAAPELGGEEDAELLKARRQRDDEAHFGVGEGIDRCELSQTGWGVIFPAVKAGSEEEKRQAAIYEALQPLLRHRKAQAAAAVEKYYRELRGGDGYRKGETGKKYLERLKVDPGVAADPEHLPYYLLLVGSPSEIPFSVQYQLDVTYAVGRLHFDDIEDYARYAQSVVEAERPEFKLARTAAFFGVRNPDDVATKLSRELLIAPLADLVAKNPKRTAALDGWSLPRYFDERASHATLEGLLGGADTPAILFTASHGVGFDRGDKRQVEHQGALLCSDWQNPRPFVPLDERVYFAGDHIASDARLHGLIAFNFACYGGGTPQYNEYAIREGKKDDREIAERPFVSGLHRKLLAHPCGGALAAIGHIERAWSDSLPGEGGAVGNRIKVFADTMHALMKGVPVGAAMEGFNQRYAYLGTEMSGQMESLEYASAAEAPKLKTEMVRMWTAHNDARDYVVTGDPAVRLQLTDVGGAARARECLSLQSVTVTATAVVSAPVAAEAKAEAPGLESASFGIVDTMRGFLSGEPAAEPSPDVEVELDTGEPAAAKGNPFQEFAKKVVDTLGNIASDAASLEVRTFVSNTSSAVPVTEDIFAKAELRAWTRIKVDGDIDACVPQVDGQVDTALWALHVELVKQAQTHRAEMIKMMLATLGGFFKP